MQSIGLSEYCIDLNELSEKTLFAKFGQLEANHDAYKNRLKNIHSDMKQQAYKTTEIVVNFLQEKGVKRYTIMKKFFPLFAVIIVLVLAVCSFHIIPTGYTGVKTSFGQIQKTTIQSGKLKYW